MIMGLLYAIYTTNFPNPPATTCAKAAHLLEWKATAVGTAQHWKGWNEFMIFLVIFGGLMLILGSFYLVNSWQQYHQWVFATLLVLASLAITVYGVVKLPYWHHSSTAASSSQSMTTSQSQRAALQFSNKASLSGNGANQQNKEMSVLRQLQKSFSKIGSVSFDSATKTFKIDSSNGDDVDALNSLAQNPGQAKQVGWSNLTNSLDQVSEQISTALGDGYTISLQQPNDSSKTMYATRDGKATYNIADQK